MKLFLAIVSCFLTFKFGSCTILEKYISEATPCENYCVAAYNTSFKELITPCQKGCRLYTVIGLAKGTEKTSKEHSNNKTELDCFEACDEAYNKKMVKACHDGCKNEAMRSVKPEENPQNPRMLTPFMWVRSAYKSAAHNVRQMITTSFTLYLQEDSGKMVVLQTKPKTSVVNVDEYVQDLKDYKPTNENSVANNWNPAVNTNERTDWMDCISQQSGLPRWILISILFGFIIALLWLCCVTTVTAPNHYLSSAAKKLTPKNDIRYLYLYEPVDEFKVQPPNEMEEAPPLPTKVALS